MALGTWKLGHLAVRPCATAPDRGAGAPRPGAVRPQGISPPGRQASSLCGQDARRLGFVKTTRTKSGATTDYEHVRDGLKLVGNIDATNSNTAPTWTNHPHALRPLASQQVQTNSATQFINVADEISSSRRTYNPTNSAAGDTEAIAAKGRLVLINGADASVFESLRAELDTSRNPR